MKRASIDHAAAATSSTPFTTSESPFTSDSAAPPAHPVTSAGGDGVTDTMDQVDDSDFLDSMHDGAGVSQQRIWDPSQRDREKDALPRGRALLTSMSPFQANRLKTMMGREALPVRRFVDAFLKAVSSVVYYRMRAEVTRELEALFNLYSSGRPTIIFNDLRLDRVLLGIGEKPEEFAASMLGGGAAVAIVPPPRTVIVYDDQPKPVSVTVQLSHSLMREQLSAESREALDSINWLMCSKIQYHPLLKKHSLVLYHDVLMFDLAFDASSTATVRITAVLHGKHTAAPLSVIHIPQLQYMVTSATDRCLVVWKDHDDWAPIVLLKCLHPHSALHYDCSRQWIIAGSTEGTITVYDAVNKIHRARNFKAHDDWISTVLSIWELDLVATCSLDGTLKLWDRDLQHVKSLLSANSESVRRPLHDLSYSRESRSLFTRTSIGREVLMWSPFMAKPTEAISASQDKPLVSAMTFNDSFELITADSTGRISIWDAQKSHRTQTLGGGTDAFPIGEVESTCYNTAYSAIVAVGIGGISVFVPLRGSADTRIIAPVSNIVWSASRNSMIAASGTNMIEFSLENRSVTRSHQSRGLDVATLAVSRDETVIVVGLQDGTVQVMDMATWGVERSLPGGSSDTAPIVAMDLGASSAVSRCSPAHSRAVCVSAAGIITHFAYGSMWDRSPSPTIVIPTKLRSPSLAAVCASVTYAYIVDSGTHVHVCDLSTESMKPALTVNTSRRVTALTVCELNMLLLVGLVTGGLTAYAIPLNTPLIRIELTSGLTTVTSLTATPKATWVACIAGERALTVNCSQINRLAVKDQAARSVFMDPNAPTVMLDGKRLVVEGQIPRGKDGCRLTCYEKLMAPTEESLLHPLTLCTAAVPPVPTMPSEEVATMVLDALSTAQTLCQTPFGSRCLAPLIAVGQIGPDMTVSVVPRSDRGSTATRDYLLSRLSLKPPHPLTPTWTPAGPMLEELLHFILAVANALWLLHSRGYETFINPETDVIVNDRRSLLHVRHGVYIRRDGVTNPVLLRLAESWYAARTTTLLNMPPFRPTQTGTTAADNVIYALRYFIAEVVDESRTVMRQCIDHLTLHHSSQAVNAATKDAQILATFTQSVFGAVTDIPSLMKETKRRINELGCNPTVAGGATLPVLPPATNIMSMVTGGGGAAGRGGGAPSSPTGSGGAPGSGGRVIPVLDIVEAQDLNAVGCSLTALRDETKLTCVTLLGGAPLAVLAEHNGSAGHVQFHFPVSGECVGFLPASNEVSIPWVVNEVQTDAGGPVMGMGRRRSTAFGESSRRATQAPGATTSSGAEAKGESSGGANGDLAAGSEATFLEGVRGRQSPKRRKGKWLDGEDPMAGYCPFFSSMKGFADEMLVDAGGGGADRDVAHRFLEAAAARRGKSTTRGGDDDDLSTPFYLQGSKRVSRARSLAILMAVPSRRSKLHHLSDEVKRCRRQFEEANTIHDAEEGGDEYGGRHHGRTTSPTSRRRKAKSPPRPNSPFFRSPDPLSDPALYVRSSPGGVSPPRAQAENRAEPLRAPSSRPVSRTPGAGASSGSSQRQQPPLPPVQQQRQQRRDSPKNTRGGFRPPPGRR